MNEPANFKRLLMLTTGGTIASRSHGEGLAPEFRAGDILRFIPAFPDSIDIDTKEICSIDSTNMTPVHWLAIADAIRSCYDMYDGFVILHGTDTMAYTAAALSYLIQDSPKPIVLTGAQKPIDRDITDSKSNLINAFRYAAFDGASGVQIVFDGKVILGTRAKKIRTKSYHAFSSINYPDLASVCDGRIFSYIREPKCSSPLFFERLDPSVALVKLIPGEDASFLRWRLSRCRAVIIESFGVGGVPTEGGFYEAVKDAVAAGKTVVITTQVESEGSDIGVYQVGYRLKGLAGVLEAYDMTLEAVVTKLMWALAQTADPAEIKQMFYTPVAHDILGNPADLSSLH